MHRIRKIGISLLIVAMLFATLITPMMSVSALYESGLSTNSNYNVTFGCDLSYWNVGGSSLKYSLVDFAKMKADGCDFAILRIGLGTSHTMDKAFLQFYNSARAAGMDLGIYFYSHSTTYAGAVADAQWVMSIIEKYDMYFEYPIYYDVEEKSQTSLSSANLTSLCRGWCETLENAGYFPGIYGITSTIKNLSSSFRSTYDCWVARVKTDSHTGSASNQFNPNSTYYNDVASMWQYSWYDYEYDGIGLDMLDVNVSYKDYPAIMKKYGYNNIVSDGLGDAINAALTADYTLYTADQIENIRAVYADAKALYYGGTATTAQKAAKAEELMNALGTYASANESILSKNKSYTATAPNRPSGDAVDWNDDGVRLTNGKKSNTNVSTSEYAAWTEGATVDIVVDLGYSQLSNIFRVYAAGGDWGVSAPASFSVSYSSDGQSFTPIATVQTRKQVSKDGNWIFYCYSHTADEAVNARYIKFTVTPDGVHNWLDEVEVAYDPTPALTNCIKINGINGYIMSGITYLFTPAYGTITVDNANHAWTRNVVARWSATDNAYVVTSTTVGNGSSTPAVTLASNEIMLAAHNWETNITDGTAVLGSELNTQNLAALKVGDLLTLNGIDVANQTHHVIPYIVPTFVDTTEPVEPPVDPVDPPVDTEPKAVVSLGAAANETTGAIRFGATFTKHDAESKLVAFGFLVITEEARCGETLDLSYNDNATIKNSVMNDKLCKIVEYSPELTVDDYDSFSFYTTLTEVESDTEFAAVPYIVYAGGFSVCGDMIVNSYSGILAGESSFE